MSLTINTNGNGVQIIPPEGAPVNFNNARYRWYFFDGNLILNAGGCAFIAAIGEVTIDGDTPANEADLNAGLGTVLPAGSSTPTLNDVLLQGNNAGNTRIANMGAPRLPNAGGGKDAVTVDFLVAAGEVIRGSYANNAAALADNVFNNQLYYTDVAGERLVKIAHE